MGYSFTYDQIKHIKSVEIDQISKSTKKKNENRMGGKGVGAENHPKKARGEKEEKDMKNMTLCVGKGKEARLESGREKKIKERSVKKNSTYKIGV